MTLDLALLAARLLLAGVFIVSGIAKLRDRGGTHVALAEFGLPAPLAGRVAAALLPVAELAVAAALIPATTAVAGATGAVALLGAFTLAIAVNLARGKRPDCHCFGQLHSAPIGPGQLIRNALLISVAAFVIGAGGGVSIAATWTGLSAAAQAAVVVGIVLGTVVAVEGAILAQLFVRYGRLLVRVDELDELVAHGTAMGAAYAPSPSPGLPVGSPAPAFSLQNMTGGETSLDDLRAAERPVLLIFSDPSCGPCQALVPEIVEWQRDLHASATIAVLSRGSRADNRKKFAVHGIEPVLRQSDQEIAVAYQYAGTPGAVVVNADGTIGSAVAAGADQIRHLVAALDPSVPVRLGRRPEHNGHHELPGEPPPPGAPAPALELPDLAGTTVDLASMRGRELLLTFWNPGCGFCTQLLPDLREWESRRPDGAPDLVVVTTGSETENRELGFRSTVLLDESASVSAQFGAHGTPMAIRIDREGRIASPLAIGGPAIMELAERSSR